MNLRNLNQIIHSNLRVSKIIKNNLSNDLLIIENKNIGITGKLKTVKLENTPINNCWIFEHEDSETELKANGSKVEKTILLLSEEKKELFVIAIEMKSRFTIDELLSCEKKINCSLSHLSIFLATNNHMVEKYNDYKLKFRLAIYCNNEHIDSKHPLFSQILCKSFLDYRAGIKKRFSIQINSPSLGFVIIPSICIHQNGHENIVMDFNTLLSELDL